MTTHKNKPWEEIKKSVVTATKDRSEFLYGGQKPYIKIKYIVEWILERKEKYTVFRDATATQIKVWIQQAVHQMGWRTWSGSINNSRSITYIVPWMEVKNDV